MLKNTLTDEQICSYTWFLVFACSNKHHSTSLLILHKIVKKNEKEIYDSDFLRSITLTSCVILRHLASFKLILNIRYEFYIKNYVTFDFERRFLPRKNALLQGYQRSSLKIHEKNESEDHDILICGAIEVGRIFLSGIFLRKVFRPSEDPSRSYWGGFRDRPCSNTWTTSYEMRGIL